MLTVAGCQKNEANGNANGAGDIPGYNESADQNKPSGVDDPSVSTEDYIIATGKALIDEFDYTKWRADAEFVHKVVKAIQEKSRTANIDALKEWAEDLGKIWEQDPIKEGNTTVYKTVVRLSDAKGHFEEQADGSFKKTDANDLSITVNVDGEKVSATFSCTDSTVPVMISGHYSSGYYDGTNPASAQANETWVYLPTSANLKILRGDAEFASLALTATVDVKDPQSVSPYTDSANLSATLKISRYTVAIQKLAYSPTGANVAIKILADNNSLITANANASYTLDQNAQGGLPVKSGSATADIDVMGRIQVKASMPSYEAFMKALEQVQQARDEQSVKTAAVAMEATFSAGMYFNGASTARATLGVQAMQNQYYSGGWYADPVLRFSDGKSYSVDEYFTEERFGELINYARNWLDNIQHQLSDLFGDL